MSQRQQPNTDIGVLKKAWADLNQIRWEHICTHQVQVIVIICTITLLVFYMFFLLCTVAVYNVHVTASLSKLNRFQ